jgi:1-deoxy-D-xylulose-5-phosphate reductoisomerase
MIRVAILGSTGSIGRSALDVVARHPGRFEIVALATNRNVDALAEQVAEHRPRLAVVADERARNGPTPSGVGTKGSSRRSPRSRPVIELPSPTKSRSSRAVV